MTLNGELLSAGKLQQFIAGTFGGVLQWRAVGGGSGGSSVTGASLAEMQARSDDAKFSSALDVAQQRGKIKAYAFAALPTTTHTDGSTVESGDIVQLTDKSRSLVRWNGTRWAKVKHEIDPADFGADESGVVDSRAAVQAAIDYARTLTVLVQTTGQPADSTTVKFRGTYLLSGKLTTYLNINLVGDYRGSVLKTTAGYTDNAILELSGGASGFYLFGDIQGLSFDSSATTGTDVAAIRTTATALSSFKFADLIMETQDGIVLDNTYVQHVLFHHIFTRGVGITKRFIWLKGNINTIRDCAEDNTANPAGTLAHIKIIGDVGLGNAEGNALENVLIEGSCGATRPAVHLLNTGGTIIDRFWYESSTPCANNFVIENSTSPITFKGMITHVFRDARIQLINSHVVLEGISSNGDDIPLASIFNIDANSAVHIGQAESMRGDNGFDISGKMTARDHYIHVTNPAGVSKMISATLAGRANLLKNGSFEQGGNGYLNVGTFGAVTFPVSDIAPGLMVKLTNSAGGISYYYQNVTIPADYIGKTLTFSALVRVVGNGFAGPYVDGAGMVSSNGIQRVNAAGWRLISYTFTPSAAGNLGVGISTTFIDAATEVYVDQMQLSFGTTGSLGDGATQELLLGSQTNTITYGAAIPTTGTWKRGDVVLNTGAITAGGTGWRCSVAGTPGTWEAVGGVDDVWSQPTSATGRIRFGTNGLGFAQSGFTINSNTHLGVPAGSVFASGGAPNTTWQILSAPDAVGRTGVAINLIAGHTAPALIVNNSGGVAISEVTAAGGGRFSSIQNGTAAGPTWTTGAGVPSGACTTGSFYSNTTGGAGTSWYVCESSAWVAK
jgi:hypothetical protein